MAQAVVDAPEAKTKAKTKATANKGKGKQGQRQTKATANKGNTMSDNLLPSIKKDSNSYTLSILEAAQRQLDALRSSRLNRTPSPAPKDETTSVSNSAATSNNRIYHLPVLAITSIGRGLAEPATGALQLAEQVANACTARIPGVEKSFFRPEQFSPSERAAVPKYSPDWFVENICESVGKIPWYILAAKATSRLPGFREEAGHLSSPKLLGASIKSTSVSGFIVGALNPTDVQKDAGLTSGLKERFLQGAIGAGQMALMTAGTAALNKGATCLDSSLVKRGGTVVADVSLARTIAVKESNGFGMAAASPVLKFAKHGSIAAVGSIPAGLAAGYTNARLHGVEFDPAENVVATMTVGFGLGGCGSVKIDPQFVHDVFSQAAKLVFGTKPGLNSGLYEHGLGAGHGGGISHGMDHYSGHFEPSEHGLDEHHLGPFEDLDYHRSAPIDVGKLLDDYSMPEPSTRAHKRAIEELGSRVAAHGELNAEQRQLLQRAEEMVVAGDIEKLQKFIRAIGPELQEILPTFAADLNSMGLSCRYGYSGFNELEIILKEEAVDCSLTINNSIHNTKPYLEVPNAAISDRGAGIRFGNVLIKDLVENKTEQALFSDLEKKNDPSALARFAEKADDPNLASRATTTYSLNAENHEDWLPTLRRLATSDTKAAGTALRICCEVDSENLNFVRELTGNTKLQKMWCQGKIEIGEALEIVQKTDKGKLDPFVSNLFDVTTGDPIMQRELSMALLKEIRGESALTAMGVEHNFWNIDVSEALRLRAVDSLVKIAPWNLEFLLLRGQAGADSVFADHCRKNLLQIWQSKPSDPCSPLILQNDNLQRCIDRASMIRWSEDATVEDRTIALQRGLDDLTNMLGLTDTASKPSPIRLKLVDSIPSENHANGASGIYWNGEGRIEMLDSIVREGGGRLTTEAAEVLLHEITHLDQDILDIRGMLDYEIGGAAPGLNPDMVSPAMRDKIKYQYSPYYPLEDSLLDLAIDIRRGQFLSPEEQFRINARMQNLSTVDPVELREKIDRIKKVDPESREIARTEAQIYNMYRRNWREREAYEVSKRAGVYGRSMLPR